MRKVPCEIYSRVVGFFRPVWSVIDGKVTPNWNAGKQEEFKNRLPYSVTTSLAHPDKREGMEKK